MVLLNTLDSMKSKLQYFISTNPEVFEPSEVEDLYVLIDNLTLIFSESIDVCLRLAPLIIAQSKFYNDLYKSKMQNAKNIADTTYSNICGLIRKSSLREGRKLTESQVRSLVYADTSYIEAIDEVNRVEIAYGFCSALYEGARSFKDSVIQLSNNERSELNREAYKE